MRVIRLGLVALAACGGDSTPAQMDAPAKKDAAPTATVVTADCNSTTAAATITTTDLVDAFMPMTATITMGQVVKFTTSSLHNVAPNPIQHTDPGLVVDFNTTKCLRFTQTGTWNFMCSAHGFVGSVTVN